LQELLAPLVAVAISLSGRRGAVAISLPVGLPVVE
jgi:hypothetical protein